MDLDNLDNLFSAEDEEEMAKKREERLKEDEKPVEGSDEECVACNI